MSESIKVTRDGYNKLSLRKQELIEQLRSIQGQKGEAAEIGGNAWHDNFSFEELVRQETMLNTRITDISKQINQADMVGSPINDEILQIGHVGVFELDDGEGRKYEIVGFGESDLNAVPPKIEYRAPIVRHFIGQDIGVSATVILGGKAREVTLVEILRKEA
ncbi:MAG: GreA/GreB family elongation factor [bacterium]